MSAAVPAVIEEGAELPPADLVPVTKAAKAVGLSKAWVYLLTERREIKAYEDESQPPNLRKRLVSISELKAVTKARRRTVPDLSSVREVVPRKSPRRKGTSK